MMGWVEDVQSPLMLGEKIMAHGAIYLRVVVCLAICVVMVLALGNQKFWPVFAEKNKGASRLLIGAFALALVPGLLAVQGLIVARWPARVVYEQPSLVAAAIKLSLYNAYLDHEISGAVPPEKQAAVRCVELLSLKEAKEQKWSCIDEDACTGMPPALTREAIIQKIREIQSMPADSDTQELHEACQPIDAEHL